MGEVVAREPTRLPELMRRQTELEAAVVELRGLLEDRDRSAARRPVKEVADFDLEAAVQRVLQRNARVPVPEPVPDGPAEDAIDMTALMRQLLDLTLDVWLGSLLMDRGEGAKAREVWLEGLALFPSHASLQGRLASFE